MEGSSLKNGRRLQSRSCRRHPWPAGRAYGAGTARSPVAAISQGERPVRQAQDPGLAKASQVAAFTPSKSWQRRAAGSQGAKAPPGDLKPPTLPRRPKLSSFGAFRSPLCPPPSPDEKRHKAIKADQPKSRKKLFFLDLPASAALRPSFRPVPSPHPRSPSHAKSLKRPKLEDSCLARGCRIRFDVKRWKSRLTHLLPRPEFSCG
jgi:hypothetical protein